MALVWVGSRGTVKDFPGFSAGRDADAIRKAIQGLGTDEDSLINILTQRSNSQRQLIAKEYEAACGKELKDDLKGDLSGNFEHLLVSLTLPPAYFDAKQLKKAMKGTGTSENILIEILASRTSKQMKEVGDAYYTVYGKSLGDNISSETSGDFRKALLFLANARRDESSKVDEHLAKKDAEILYNAGEKKWGTDEDKFIEVLCLRSFPQLRLTFDHYKTICNKTIEESIEGEMSGHLEDLLIAIVKCARNTPGFFAERLHKAIKGAGTDEYTLTRIMVSRSEIDLLDIRTEYKKLAGESLYSAIKELSFAMWLLDFRVYDPESVCACADQQQLQEMLGGFRDGTFIHRNVGNPHRLLRGNTSKSWRYPVLWTESDTSGDYEAALLKLCGGDD